MNFIMQLLKDNKQSLFFYAGFIGCLIMAAILSVVLILKNSAPVFMYIPLGFLIGSVLFLFLPKINKIKKGDSEIDFNSESDDNEGK